MCMTVTGLTLQTSIGISELVLAAYEGLTVGIKALNGGIHL